MELSGASCVILGMLSLSPQSGYDIKSFVDVSTRHFWTISYGQIYPELRRLQSLGLVEAAEPAGGRRRTVYRLTPAGDEALLAWLRDKTALSFEVRDELLLKLFFADRLPAREAAELLQTMRERHEAVEAALHRTEPFAREAPYKFPYLVLRFGIDFHKWVAAWCGKAEGSLGGA